MLCLISLIANADELSFPKTLKYIDSLDYNMSTKEEMRQMLAVSKSITYNASNGSAQNIADGLVIMRLSDCVNKHLVKEDGTLFSKTMLDEIKSDGYYEDFQDGFVKSTMWWITTMAMKAKEDNTSKSEMKKFFSCEYRGPLDITSFKDVKSVKKPKAPNMKAYSDPLIQFYLGEYKKAAKEFMAAKGLLDIFHAHIKKNMAMDCIRGRTKSSGNEDWIGEGSKIRRVVRHDLTPTQELRKAERRNSDHMGRNFYLYDLNLVNHTTEVITNLWGDKKKQTQCQVGKSAEELYQLFLPIYVQKYKEDLTSSREHPSPKMKEHYVKYDEWLKIITESCPTCGPYRTFEQRVFDRTAETEERLFKIAKREATDPDIRNKVKRYHANINVTDDEGRTPLFYAIHSNSTDMLRSFLILGADYNIKDDYGKTVFDYFDKSVPYKIRNHLWLEKYRETHRNFRESTYSLMGKNVVESYNNPYSWTPLMHAVTDNDLQQVRKLLQSGADVDDYNNNKTTALHMAVAKGHKKIVQLLLAEGANIEATNRYGLTPIFFAIDKENLPMLELLIKHGADVNTVTNLYETPLMYAVMHLKNSMLEPLIQNGADYKRRDKHGSTLLFDAVWFKNTELTDFLLTNGVDIDAKNKANKHAYDLIRVGTPEPLVKLLQIAYLKNHPEEKAPVPFMVRYKEKNRKPTPIQKAVNEEDVEKLRVYLRKLGNDAEKGKTLNKMLFRAINKNSPDMIELLIDHGALLDARNKEGNTPLSYAISFSKVDFFKILVDKGADINAPKHSKSGYIIAPVHHAAQAKEVKILEILIQAGVDVNKKEATSGRTPLMFAVGTCRDPNVIPTFQILLDHGADITLKDDQGMSVLDIAQKKCKKNRREEEVMTFLKNHSEKTTQTN